MEEPDTYEMPYDDYKKLVKDASKYNSDKSFHRNVLIAITFGALVIISIVVAISTVGYANVQKDTEMAKACINSGGIVYDRHCLFSRGSR